MLPILNLTPILNDQLTTLGYSLKERNLRCVTAESCTGGMLGAAMTAIAGSSAWFMGGVMAYANDVKINVLNVPEFVIVQDGAVSQSCVIHMASGVCKTLQADVGVAISGIAGPDGGSVQKPVGTVWIGYSVLGKESAEHFIFNGNREEVRSQAVMCAVQGLVERLK